MFEIWTNFSSGIFEYALSAYSRLEPWTYPLLLVGILGYVYMASRSVTACIISILITFGIFAGTTSIFDEVPSLSVFLLIVTVVGLSLIIVALVLKVVDRI